MNFDQFVNRHIGPNHEQITQMLNTLKCTNLDELISKVVPQDLIQGETLNNTPALSEFEALHKLKNLGHRNQLGKLNIGMGYYDTITPSVIKRNVLENPGWYTAYTPYQAEIAQGRLEALMNFQQMIMDLTGFDLANASLLDEATACAEAMSMSRKLSSSSSNKFLIDHNCHPSNIDVVKTRAQYQQIEVVVADIENADPSLYFGALIQNPNLYGELKDYSNLISKFKTHNVVTTMVYDIMAMILFKSPQQMGADIAVGSTQRFGIPIGFGGPSAAYMATSNEHKRIMPGRIIGVSVDANGKQALRMALQTREQHIRREKATSNICTSQVLLANMAGFYVVYHGSEGLNRIASNIHNITLTLKHYLQENKINVVNHPLVFDTLTIEPLDLEGTYRELSQSNYFVGKYNGKLIINIGESTTLDDVINLVNLISGANLNHATRVNHSKMYDGIYRNDSILTHPVFNRYRSETQMMRYLKHLENKDLSLVHSMIPLGSCTMKLNSSAELEALSWDNFANIHPYAPKTSISGYLHLLDDLSHKLCDITGFDSITMQPNSGAQGEFTGILAIRRYLASINQGHRNICLIPKSAHGTNPATAQMMGLEVVVVNCDDNGNVDIADLEKKAQEHSNNLCCLMITYPSTHGVFEAAIKQICNIIHLHGGQVYMDGANLNALVGLIKVANLGADVSHMNLHKTFAIPHGGGGPGMGPIGVKSHLSSFLPKSPIFDGVNGEGYSVSSSPFGSASILTISWMYITMLGSAGLKKSTQVAILNANYIAHRLKDYYPILYTGQNHMVAHECIIDLRPFKAQSGISEVDIAKRLMDYGFHSPTMSFPVPGTLMIEPTESEDLGELDRFINAMIQIHDEIKLVQNGTWDKLNNPLKNAPHTLNDVMNWNKPYSITDGCFPNQHVKNHKFFPSVNRIDDAHGDRNFICNCFEIEE